MLFKPSIPLSLRHHIRLVAVFSILLIISGCVTTSTVQQIDQLESIGENPRIVLMPPDIKYYLLTAGGVTEPHAEWTDAAKENFGTAIVAYADSIGTDLTVIDQNNLSGREIQYETLHSAVGTTILQNYFGTLKLPSKGEQFDWSLGPEISSIGEDHDADYALFVYYRDYQASGGRVAFAILAAAAGAGVSTGSEHGFASLVDLKTGDIVWFNVVRAGSGELRDRNGATAAVSALFKDIPGAPVSGDIQ
jgi:hypothetical protein